MMIMWTAKVTALRNLVDSNTPIVFEGSWERLGREGWRWATNLLLSSDAYNKRAVENYVRIHGPLNVALGQKFNNDDMKPRPEPAYIGLYVRDVDIQAEQMAKLLEDDEAIERWLDDAKGK